MIDPIKRLRYVPKYAKAEETPKSHSNIFHMLMPSVIGVMLCAVCLVGGTFAWFKSYQVAVIPAVQTATYTVKPRLVASDGAELACLEEKPDGAVQYTYRELAPGRYTLTLTSAGTATKGYCEVKVGEQTLYTEQFAGGQEVKLELSVNEAVSVTVTPCWGISIKAEAPDIKLDGTSAYSHGVAQCVCTLLCAGDAPNADCLVCGAGAIGTEGGPVCAGAGCTCEDKCHPDDVDAACQLCGADADRCGGTEVCACKVSCDGAVNESCYFCKEGVGLCEGAKCVCTVSCLQELNEDCLACVNHGSCLGKADTTEPEATDPEVTDPEVTDPEATEPEVTDPEVTAPEVTQPEATDPEVTQPEATDPEVTQPEAAEPEVTEPEVTQPEATDPETTDPEATEPEVTQPETTDSEATEPEATEPETTDAPAAQETTGEAAA